MSDYFENHADKSSDIWFDHGGREEITETEMQYRTVLSRLPEIFLDFEKRINYL